MSAKSGEVPYALASAADAKRYMPVMSISIASRISYLKGSIELSSFERVDIGTDVN